jgi:two-component sensor histidine kinase
LRYGDLYANFRAVPARAVKVGLVLDWKAVMQDASKVKSRLIDKVRPWLPPLASPKAYLCAVILIGLAVLARIPMDAVARQPLPPYITLYPAIVLGAFLGGVRVGLFAVVLSAVVAWTLWMSPPTPGALGPLRIMTALVYLCTASVTILTSGMARLLLDELASTEDLRQRAAQESVHRIKNLLAVVQSISRKISASAGDVKSYRDRLDERLNALAVTQDMLLKSEWQDLPVEELVHATLGPFLPNPRLHVQIEYGASVPARAVTQFSMALYELATNAMKYGALANPQGSVELRVRRLDDHFHIEWQERGLAISPSGDRVGLGTKVIRSALSAVPAGQVHYEVGTVTVGCRFVWPAPPSERADAA